MRIPVLPAVVLLSVLALHSAQGAALGGAEVSTAPGFSLADTCELTNPSISLPSASY